MSLLGRRSTNKPIDPLENGLPSNLEAERLVLGTALLDDSRFGEIACLDVSDFSLDMHKLIFLRMQDLRARGQGIDRVTIADELSRRGELRHNGLSCLVSLDQGMPLLPHLTSYVRIVRDNGIRRKTIMALQKTIDECLLDAPALNDRKRLRNPSCLGESIR